MFFELSVMITFIFVIQKGHAQTTHFNLTNSYAIDIWSPYSFSLYDTKQNLIQYDECKNVYLSLTPTKPNNAAKYSLYDSSNVFIKDSYNAYQFWDVPAGNYIIKDGNVEIIRLKSKSIDRKTLFKVIITDQNYIEVEDFSYTNLNLITLKTAIKNLTSDSINTCVNSFPNWSVNGKSIYSQPIFKEGDQICVMVDGTEECTKGCFSLNEACVIAGKALPTSLKNFNSIPNNLNISPNPFSSHANLRLPTNDTYSLKIVDLQSRIIMQFNNISNEKNEITSEGILSGIYFIILINQINGSVYKDKLIINK